MYQTDDWFGFENVPSLQGVCVCGGGGAFGRVRGGRGTRVLGCVSILFFFFLY